MKRSYFQYGISGNFSLIVGMIRSMIVLFIGVDNFSEFDGAR